MARISPGAYAPGLVTLSPPPDHLSFSQITALSSRYRTSCPRKWAYNKLFGLPDAPSNAMLLGSALDTAAEHFFALRMKGEGFMAAVAAARPLVGQMLNAGQWTAQKHDLGAYVVMQERAFDALVATLNDTVPAAIQAGHEMTFRALDGEIRRLIGFSDWIEADGRIVDLKFTGRAKWDAAGTPDTAWLSRVRDQTCYYYMSRKQTGDDSIPIAPHGAVVVVQAAITQTHPRVRRFEFTFPVSLIAELADVAREADAYARVGTHPPRPGKACEFCPYVDRCVADSARLCPSDKEIAEVA